MKNVLNIVLAIFFVTTSCVTERKCLQKFPCGSDTIQVTTVKDSVVYRDTTIFVTIKGETRIDSVFIPCPEVAGYVPDTVKVETNYAKAWAWWQFPNIRLKLEDKDTTLRFQLDNAVREEWHWRNEYLKVVREKKVIPKFYEACVWILGGEILFIILFFLLRRFVK